MGQREDRFTQLTQPAGCTLQPAFPPCLEPLFPGWTFFGSTITLQLRLDFSLRITYSSLGFLDTYLSPFHVFWMKEREKQTSVSIFCALLGFISFCSEEFVNGLQDACQVKRFAGFSKTGRPPGKNCTFSLC